MQDTFKNFMRNTYSIDELKDIASYGCQGGVSGLIYYEETTDLYFRYSEELHQIIGDYADELGCVPEYITNKLGDAVQFRNAVVWFCAESYARELQDETEEA
jgi:hypothetical protein